MINYRNSIYKFRISYRYYKIKNQLLNKIIINYKIINNKLMIINNK